MNEHADQRSAACRYAFRADTLAAQADGLEYHYTGAYTHTTSGYDGAFAWIEVVNPSVRPNTINGRQLHHGQEAQRRQHQRAGLARGRLARDRLGKPRWWGPRAVRIPPMTPWRRLVVLQRTLRERRLPRRRPDHPECVVRHWRSDVSGVPSHLPCHRHVAEPPLSNASHGPRLPRGVHRAGHGCH